LNRQNPLRIKRFQRCRFVGLGLTEAIRPSQNCGSFLVKSMPDRSGALGMSDRMDEAINILLATLAPYVENTLTARWQANWLTEVNSHRARRTRYALKPVSPGEALDWELYNLFTVINDLWNDTFAHTIPSDLRAGAHLNISKLLELRNIYSHPKERRRFTPREAARFFDFSESLLRSIGKANAAESMGVIYELHAKDIVKAGEANRTARIARLFENAESMRGSGVIYDLLGEECSQNCLFPGAQLKMVNRPIGRLVVPMAVGIFAKGVPVRLGKLDRRLRTFAQVEQDEYIQQRDTLIGNTLIGKTDKITYTAQRIVSSGDHCEIEGGITRYLSGLKAHHALQHELLAAAYDLHAEGRLTVGNLKPLLKRRNQFFQLPSEQQQWYRTLSISALIVHKTKDEGYKIMVRKRSKMVASDQNLIQAITSFTFQPELDIEKEWDVQHCLTKEYCEELFDEKVDEAKADRHDFIYDKFPPARQLKEALASGQCELLYSGVVLHLMLLFPEIFCVLLVHDHEWFAEQQRRFLTNWEFVSRHDILHSGAVLTEYHLDDAESEFLEQGRMTVSDIWRTWSPFGMGSFWLGIDAARKRLAQRAE